MASTWDDDLPIVLIERMAWSDLSNATRRDCNRCPVARAVNRWLRKRGHEDMRASTSGHRCTIWAMDEEDGDMAIARYGMTDETARSVARFDAGMEGAFELRVPGEPINLIRVTGARLVDAADDRRDALRRAGLL